MGQVPQHQIPSPMPWALSIADASKMVGMSRSQFRRVFIDSGRIRPIHSGERVRIVLMAQLRDAFDAYIAEKSTALD